MYLNLMNEMRKNHITVDNIATLLGLHRNSIRSRNNGAIPYTVDEAFLVKSRFFPYADIEWLFRNYNENAGQS